MVHVSRDFSANDYGHVTNASSMVLNLDARHEYWFFRDTFDFTVGTLV